MERYIADVRAFYDHLPADKFPHLAKHLDDLTGGDREERFEFGLDMLIRSLATYSSSDVPAPEA